jgi:hypothetical protein
MATTAYYAWKADGEPYRDCQPTADSAAIGRGHGYTVYTRGDDRHMRAEPPQDHTAFSATGYPRKSAYGVGHAEDWMPPPAGSHLPTLAQLGAQIVKDKNAGYPGTESIKYINWTDENGDCWQDSWEPDHKRERSSDRGHNHISRRSDMDTAHTDYDPVARVLEDDMTAEQLLDEDVVPNRPWRADVKTNPKVRWEYAVTDTWDLAHAAAADAKAAKDGVAKLLAAPPGTVTISDEQLERVIRKVFGGLDGAVPPAA